MKIVATGASGFIANRLIGFLVQKGHSVIPVSRRGKEVGWDPQSGRVWGDPFNGADCVINLAGESIFGIWSADKKRKIHESRILSTKLAVEQIQRYRIPLFLCASAVGIYGNREMEPLTEKSPPGKGFMADVCIDWEHEALEAEITGTRVVLMRFGVVLDKDGGMLPKVAILPRLRIIPVPGRGMNYLSWIHIDDLKNAVEFIIENEKISGPVNIVAPSRTRTKDFYRMLKEVVAGRFGILLSIPEIIILFSFGDLGRELLLGSQMAIPTKLEENGFKYSYPDLKSALESLLKKDG